MKKQNRIPLAALVVGMGITSAAVGSAAAAVVQGARSGPQLAPLAFQPAGATAIPPMPTTTTLDAEADPTRLAAIAAAKRAAAVPQVSATVPSASLALPVVAPSPADPAQGPVAAPAPTVTVPVATIGQRPAPVSIPVPVTTPTPTTTPTIPQPAPACAITTESAEMGTGTAIFDLTGGTTPFTVTMSATVTYADGAPPEHVNQQVGSFTAADVTPVAGGSQFRVQLMEAFDQEGQAVTVTVSFPASGVQGPQDSCSTSFTVGA